ncbi:primosome, DnaD subunit [Alkaliphilus oremlandii OhILAs]|uniref:Primosome, DnaD subunit n=2 Tax=Alkaliphilus oremlandii TaxID=461876 RepID=A8MKJ3_ALKOO|nr:primosome, DnaD subunit [Alkaliphilus oremlandii OhILAs]
MMSFIKGNTSIDLGDTPIENIFIDVYMPMTNGTFVQVYLLGYKYAFDRDPNMEVSNLSIAKHLNIPLSDVLSAWDFWESKKIIVKHPSDDGDENNYKVEFVNLKQLYIDNNYKPTYAISSEESTASQKPSTYTCSPEDLLEANKVPEIRALFVEIRKIIARELQPNEMSKIIELIKRYNVDTPLIAEAFRYSKEQGKARHILSFASGVIRNWYDQGIFTVEELNDHLGKQSQRYEIYNKVFKSLGFASRGPSEAEKKIMDSWVDQFHFTIDVILAACQNSSKTSNPSINYIHAILKSWYESGIKEVGDIERLDKIERKSTSSKPVQAANKIKTKFHLAKSRGDKYTADELEALILNNQKNKLNR